MTSLQALDTWRVLVVWQESETAPQDADKKYSLKLKQEVYLAETKMAHSQTRESLQETENK